MTDPTDTILSIGTDISECDDLTPAAGHILLRMLAVMQSLAHPALPSPPQAGEPREHPRCDRPEECVQCMDSDHPEDMGREVEAIRERHLCDTSAYMPADSQADIKELRAAMAQRLCADVGRMLTAYDALAADLRRIADTAPPAGKPHGPFDAANMVSIAQQALGLPITPTPPEPCAARLRRGIARMQEVVDSKDAEIEELRKLVRDMYEIAGHLRDIHHGTNEHGPFDASVAAEAVTIAASALSMGAGTREGPVLAYGVGDPADPNTIIPYAVGEREDAMEQAARERTACYALYAHPSVAAISQPEGQGVGK